MSYNFIISFNQICNASVISDKRPAIKKFNTSIGFEIHEAMFGAYKAKMVRKAREENLPFLIFPLSLYCSSTKDVNLCIKHMDGAKFLKLVLSNLI